MSRPKSNGPELSAKIRIEEAFWELLEEMPYKDISIKRLSSQANVNHKMIYYYYNNIDDMAQHLFEENIRIYFSESNPLLAVLSGQQKDFLNKKFSETGTKRALLYGTSDSAFLNAIFKQYIRKNWLLSLNITEDNLSEDEKVDLEFIISGMISLIGKDFSPNNILRVLRIFDRDLGKSVQSTLIHLKRRNNHISTINTDE